MYFLSVKLQFKIEDRSIVKTLALHPKIGSTNVDGCACCVHGVCEVVRACGCSVCGVYVCMRWCGICVSCEKRECGVGVCMFGVCVVYV